MKLIDAIRRVERPESDNIYRFWSDLEGICGDLSIQSPWDLDDDAINLKLKTYPIATWCCTDAHVGLNAIYLGDEPVGSSWQTGRKMDKTFQWVSKEAALKVRDFILSFRTEPEFEVGVIDENEDIGPDLRVQFCGQALTDEGFYEGRPVRALIWYDGLMGRSTPVEYRREGQSYFEKVDYEDPRQGCVLVQDGDVQRVIPIPEFAIPFNLKPGV